MLAANAALASGGMTHCFLRWGLSVFCPSVRPIVLSLATLNDVQFRTASSSNNNVHRAHGDWRFGAGNYVQLGLGCSVERCAFWPTLAERGRVRTASRPSSTGCWRVQATSTDVDIQSRGDLAVAPSAARPRDPSAFNRMRAFTNWPARCLPLWIRGLSQFALLIGKASRHTSLRQHVWGHELTISVDICGAYRSRRSTTKSMTRPYWSVGRFVGFTRGR